MKADLVNDDFVDSRAAPKDVSYGILFPLALLGLVWFEVIRHLQNEWSYNPQYSYGWSVPFLSLFLLWKRWPSRPLPEEPPSPTWPKLLLLSGSLLLLPVRFLSEANPDWRLLSWAGAIFALAVSFSLILLVGGRPWVRHFAFPFLFLLVAVPWPVQLEQIVIQTLMQAVTAINVFGLHLAAIPALRHGNVIEIGAGMLGIEDACSGVRSLQATFMISLFLGELYTFSVHRRVLLVVAGALLAFACNLVRTAILIWVGTTRGMQAIHAWHDPAGLTILLVCLFGLWAISLWIQRGMAPEALPVGSGVRRLPFRLSLALLGSVTIWLLLTEAGVQLWYNAHAAPLNISRWSAQWPTASADFSKVAIALEAESLLRYNEGGGGSWSGTDGHRWTMYFFRWLPGRTAALFVKIHRPDVCLPASGMTMVNDNGIQLIDLNGVKLPIRSYRFDDHGTPLHVFYCYWDARSSYENNKSASEEDWSARGRIRAALRGRRETGAQMLELVVSGYEDDAAAAAALQQQLSRIVVRG